MGFSKKKILLFGPFGDFGGRELEVSFIASVLASKYEVDICTSDSVSAQSQLYYFNRNQKVFSLKGLLCKKYFALNILSFCSYLKNSFKGVSSSYANNNVAKRYFNYEKRTAIILEDVISKYDLVFICAQFSSNYIDNIVSFSKKHHVKIIFRTTGHIKHTDFNYLKDVNLFIHHSLNNARRLEFENFDVIDQCSFMENELLSLVNVNTGSRFLLLGRLSAEKGFEEVIDFFIKCKKPDDKLTIVGEGQLKEKLEQKYSGFAEIQFLGYLKADVLWSIFEKTDCLIIPSFEESGPLVGVEAMAAGKIIISTKVGAMPERLENTLNDFWFDINDFYSFEREFNRFKKLDNVTSNAISQSLRNEYKKAYSIESISIKYLNSIDKVLGL
jgi:glycosyltransferase involved in cell wall biosynthesis